MNRRTAKFLAATCGILLVLACAKSGGGEQQSGSVKGGPGVTSSTITLGVLTDLSGVFAALGQPLNQAQQQYWDGVNKAGGVCGRQVNLMIQDHGYNPQKAVTQYRDMSGQIAGLANLLGSPIVAALLPTLQQDTMYAAVAGWPGSLLNNQYVQITGATYDIEAINGVDYLADQGKVKNGDAIGVLYFQGDFGENALAGVNYAAGKHGLTVVKQQVTPAQADMSAQVAAFQRGNVKAIWIAAAPTQTASLAGVAAATGLNVPIMGDGPAFAPQLLSTPAAGALTSNFYLVTSLAPPSLDKPAVKKATQDFTAAYPQTPPAAVSTTIAVAESMVTKQVLTKACANKDLTRQGLVNALHQISNFDTGGLVAGPVDFTKVGQPSTRAVYIARVDSSVPGSTKSIGVFESANAKSYQEGQ